MKYVVMDSLKAAISDNYIFMYIIGDRPKVISVEDNKMHLDILSKCKEITQEEFENTLPTQGLLNSLFAAQYYAVKEKN